MPEHGAVLIDGVQRGHTQRCPHCGGHFLVASHGTLAEAKQSPISDVAYPRAFCQRCGRLTCGRPCCDPAKFCVPHEVKLEYREGKRGTQYDELLQLLESRGWLV